MTKKLLYITENTIDWVCNNVWIFIVAILVTIVFQLYMSWPKPIESINKWYGRPLSEATITDLIFTGIALMYFKKWVVDNK